VSIDPAEDASGPCGLGTVIEPDGYDGATPIDPDGAVILADGGRATWAQVHLALDWLRRDLRVTWTA